MPLTDSHDVFFCFFCIFFFFFFSQSSMKRSS